MAKKSKKKIRISKHDLKEDHFVTGTLRITTWVREHQNTVLAGVAVVVVIAILATVISTSRRRSQETAAQMLGQVELLYSQGQLEQAIEQAQMLTDQFGGSQAAGRAVFYMADSRAKLERYDEAVVAYQTYIDEYHADKTLTAASYTGLAACYEQLEEFSQAGGWYLRTAEETPRYYGVPEALMNAGRCFSLSGEKEMAVEAYRTLIEKYPESRLLSEAKMELATLESSLGSESESSPEQALETTSDQEG
jgi:tetratricopeptide (TPR) repeat protein